VKMRSTPVFVVNALCPLALAKCARRESLTHPSLERIERIFEPGVQAFFFVELARIGRRLWAQRSCVESDETLPINVDQINRRLLRILIALRKMKPAADFVEEGFVGIHPALISNAAIYIEMDKRYRPIVCLPHIRHIPTPNSSAFLPKISSTFACVIPSWTRSKFAFVTPGRGGSIASTPRITATVSGRTAIGATRFLVILTGSFGCSQILWEWSGGHGDSAGSGSERPTGRAEHTCFGTAGPEYVNG
jgi:hypothetical protein